MKGKSPKFSVGTDPELVFLSQDNRIVKAESLLRRTDPFGVDGHRYIAELRPSPAFTPRKLVKNINELLATKADSLRNYKWIVGPWVKEKPLGGHIHFGIPLEDDFVDALDNYLGTVLALVEPEEQARQRRTIVFYGENPYGSLGDVRRKDWGFEWRTPSSFIVSPGVSLGIFSLAKAIIHEEMLGTKAAWTELPAKTRRILEINEKKFYECDKKHFMPKVDELWKVFRTMKYFEKGYEGHKEWSAVAYLQNRVAASLGFVPEKDIRPSWKLVGKPKTKANSPLLIREEVLETNGLPTINEFLIRIF